MKILVTGAVGFIGSHICNYFYKEGHEVFGWDRVTKNENWVLEQIDMLDETMVMQGIERIRPQIIIHCAGSADVGKSVSDPFSDYNGNVTVTHNLLFAIHRCELNDVRFVFLSSASVYGNPEKLPIDETASLNPLSPYALHKVMCEEVCKYFHANYNMDIKILRIFSAYGEGLKKQIFWDMHVKAKKTGKLAMFGSGNESRDYINVADLIRAIYIVATKAPYEESVYNIANGEEVTVKAATKLFAEAAGVEDKNISFTGEVKEGNPINWKADISKLQKLGYSKAVELQEGIASYVIWARVQE